MADEVVDKLRFRPRARIIRTIGDQLIRGQDLTAAELVFLYVHTRLAAGKSEAPISAISR